MHGSVAATASKIRKPFFTVGSMRLIGKLQLVSAFDISKSSSKRGAVLAKIQSPPAAKAR